MKRIVLRLLKRICLLVGLAVPYYLVLPEFAYAQTEIKQKPALDWGDWEQSILELDIYTLPLSPQQHEIINDKINSLKQEFGVGIVGDIEQAINEMDESSLLDEFDSKHHQPPREKKNGVSDIRDDLLLEEEILALEFAEAMGANDPEGLKGSLQINNQLFEDIMRQLELIEMRKLQEKKKVN